MHITNQELTIRDIQNESLRVMKVIHQFCKNNGINYTLYGGSLIGAIRHNGFIPWDDDLDIAMPRPDYDRFIKLFDNSDDCVLYSFERKNSTKLYGRVCDMRNTKSWVELPWYKGEVGVWIDIFPIDAVSEDIIEHAKDIRKLQHLQHMSYILRARNFCFSGLTLSLILRKIAKNVFFWWKSLTKVIKNHDLYTRKYKYGTTGYLGELCYLDYPQKEHFPQCYYDKFELHDFEDTKFMIVSEYDKLLKNYYGDYMQLPPIEEQQPMHSKEQLFYWR